MPEESNVGAIVLNIGNSDTLEKQADIMGKALMAAGFGAAAELTSAFADKALGDLAYARAYLLLLDQPILTKMVGAPNWEKIRFSMKKSDRLKALDEILEHAKGLDGPSLRMLKAKTSMMLQIVYLLRERISEEGLPELRVTSTDVVNMILKQPNLKDRNMTVDINQFGKGYWNLLVELLKEADFRSDDKILYTSLMSDSVAKRAADGLDLVSSGKAGEGGKLSETVLARMGVNVIKRLSLLLKTVKMYTSADHPSIALALETLQSTIETMLKDREKVTISRIGSDLVIEDVRLKKGAQFLDDFVTALEERNVNSMTLRKGIALEEVRAFVMIFAETAAQIKGKGGVKGILGQKSVTHVIIDQFKYGIMVDDGVVEKDDLTSDDKALDNLVFSEIVNRIRQGGALGDVKGEDVAKAFQSLMSGTYRKDSKSRVTLAQMILSLDPSLADQTLFAKGGLRDAMSWSTARSAIDQLLEEMAKERSADSRIHALDNLLKMVDLAISKNKETTLVEIIERLSGRIWFKERDIEVCSKIFEVMAEMFRSLVLANKYGNAHSILQQFDRVRRQVENLPADRQDSFTRALRELSMTAMVQCSDKETVSVLLRELESEVMSNSDQAMKVLELLGSEEVIEQLLEGFKNPSRSVRNRCFQVLQAIGEKSAAVCAWKLKNLGDPDMFMREADEKRLMDDSYYLARNAIDIIAKLGGKEEVPLFMTVAEDPDWRLRREVMTNLAKYAPGAAEQLAKESIDEPTTPKEMVESAISTLGMLKSADMVPRLIEIFYSEPTLRQPIINALSLIGGEEAEKIFTPATRIRFGGQLGRIYREDYPLRLMAVKGMGAQGHERSRDALKRLVRHWSNPLARIFFFPLKTVFKFKDLIKLAQDSLGRIEYRLKTA